MEGISAMRFHGLSRFVTRAPNNGQTRLRSFDPGVFSIAKKPGSKPIKQEVPLRLLFVAGIACAVSLGACSSEPNASTAEESNADHYAAGYAAVSPRSFTDDESVQDRRQQRCSDLTRAGYDGDPGFTADSSDVAAMFWNGCMDAMSGRAEKTSADEIAAILEAY